MSTRVLLSCLMLGAVVAIAVFITNNKILLTDTRTEPAQPPAVSKKHLLPADPPRLRKWVAVEDFDKSLAIYDTVFWEPLDTVSLRKRIRETPLVKDKTVLEIGTGSGLIALCCLHAGAKSVVATDINPNAVANARFNAKHLGYSKNLEVRLVPIDNSGAYSVIKEDERFDLIISNPPWEDEEPKSIAEFALYDQQFQLLKSILKGLRSHLRPNGKALLAYGCVDAIKKIAKLAPKYNLEFAVLDPRNVVRLPAVFLPGMLLELRVKGN